MGLYIRMALYFVFAGLASQGLVEFDEATREVTFKLDDLAIGAAGVAGYLVTFFGGRWAKKRGGNT